MNGNKESKMRNERLKEYLIDDLKKLEQDFHYIIRNRLDVCDDKEEIEYIENFFSYWDTHI